MTDEETWLFNKFRYCGPVTEEMTQMGYASYLDHYVRSYKESMARSQASGEGDKVEINWTAEAGRNRLATHLQANLVNTSRHL